MDTTDLFMELENRVAKLEQTVSALQERNSRVESDKSWEISRTRIGAIIILTYIVMCFLFYFIGVTNFFISALIPTIGYLLSTQTLPIIKRLWKQG